MQLGIKLTTHLKFNKINAATNIHCILLWHLARNWVGHISTLQAIQMHRVQIS